MVKHLTFQVVRGCMVVVQTAEAPTEEDSAAYLKALIPYVDAVSALKVLVVTEGGAPGPAMRQQIDRIVHPHKSRTKFAIVTSSTFARGVLVAIRAINPFYRGFSPNDLEGALRYLEVPAFHVADVVRSVNALRAEFGLPPVKGSCS
ncbi:MAG: hypothetical protein L6Q76_34230 [Polyangiaceae bacterium]|nr:hypothetical protein [Polyangiaceae bacterium]